MSVSEPVILGLRKSFGFGDRLGLAGSGHVAAAKEFDFAPVLAQQSIREMTRTGREPLDVMDAARKAVVAEEWDGPWGADADHLKTPEDIRRTVEAGFTMFTLDPSEFVDNRADGMSDRELRAEATQQVADGIHGEDSPESLYLGKRWEFDGAEPLSFDEETLLRAVVKYGRAVAHCSTLARSLAEACPTRPFEIEVSVDETDTPTTPLEHLWVALELRRRGVVIVSLAPRFIGDFEKGIDYKGDLEAFEQDLKRHVVIARACGPYKLSIHSGSDKFSIYPIIGRVCGDLLHVKTAGTSYLEALRVVVREDPALFREIACYAVGRFEQDRATYHISTSTGDFEGFRNCPANEAERKYLETDHGRQLLHVTFGSVLTRGKTSSGRPLKEAILEILEANPELHREVLVNHLGRHLAQLNAG